MKKRREKTRSPILAAGGIVVRGGREPLFAIVQLRKCNSWVLPKGKLNKNESALAAARREVLEEVGHKVHIHEFLGTISHPVGNRAKVVQFWRMRAIGEPVGSVARDVKAVQWLPFQEAVEKLTRPHERAFLDSVGPAVTIERSAEQDRSAERRSAERSAHQTPVASEEPQTPVASAVPPAGTPVVELSQTAATGDHVAAEDPPRDSTAEKLRDWFRRISLVGTRSDR